MKLGENILKLRKREGLSQEQLGEKVNVTRQTISNWELGETAPNPEQLKLLSKALNVSIDELLDNEIREEMMKKVSNTEQLAGMIIKILKILGIIFIIYISVIILALVGLGIYSFTTEEKVVESSATTICSIGNTKYEIEFGTDEYFKCENCSTEMQKEIKKITDFNNIESSLSKVEDYFKSHNGTCE